MFAVLKDRHGAAELSEVRRQTKSDDRRAAELMAEGNFHDALARYETKGGIKWTRTQEEAQAALVRKWAADTEADPSKTRFVFAYTNDDVDKINHAIRNVRKERGELGEDHDFATSRGKQTFAAGDRIQIIGTDKQRGLLNGQAGTITKIEDATIHLRFDGREARTITFDASEFKEFRHGYAGTIYKGQGRTLDQTYLYHSEHWRSAASYVALTRHRDKAEVFVARNTAPEPEGPRAADGARRQSQGRVALLSGWRRRFRPGSVAERRSAGPRTRHVPAPTDKRRESEPHSLAADLAEARRQRQQGGRKPETAAPRRAKMDAQDGEREAEVATAAEGDLFSPVGAGPAPTRREKDRPAWDSAGELNHKKTQFSANTTRILALFAVAAAKNARRVTSLQFFVKAGKKMVARLLFGNPD